MVSGCMFYTVTYAVALNSPTYLVVTEVIVMLQM